MTGRWCEMAGCLRGGAERIDACGSVYLCAPCRKLVEQDAAALRQDKRRPLTPKEIAVRLRDIAVREPTYIIHELYRLAHELEQTPEPVAAITGPVADDDMEALMRVVQRPARRPGLLGILRGRR